VRARVNQRHFGGKRDGRRYSTTGFSEIVVVAETSYQMSEVLSFCDRDIFLDCEGKGGSQLERLLLENGHGDYLPLQ